MPACMFRREPGQLNVRIILTEGVLRSLTILGIGVLALSTAQCSKTITHLHASVPSVSAKMIGPPELVFDTKDSCELIDIPDAFPRAYRDYNNAVHLIATHYVARAMVGPDLNRVHHECAVIYSSLHDPDPGHFQDESWLTSLFTQDGRRVAALMHSEYHGDQHAGMCADLHNPSHAQDCAWITVTYAESRDGGRSFRESRPPSNLLASLPYTYDSHNRGGAEGYDSPTNVLKLGLDYYALINVRDQYKAQPYSPCLIRTKDPFDPASWRGFDGTDFTVQFIDPYLVRNADPSQHVCHGLFAGTMDSLAIDEQSGLIVGIVYVEDNRYGHGSGLYTMATRDLIHWSLPSLAVRTGDLLESDHNGHFSYLYFALLDPDSSDRNFSTVSRTPYLYYVRLDNDNGPYKRVLLRRRISLAIQP